MYIADRRGRADNAFLVHPNNSVVALRSNQVCVQCERIVCLVNIDQRQHLNERAVAAVRKWGLSIALITNNKQIFKKCRGEIVHYAHREPLPTDGCDCDPHHQQA